MDFNGSLINISPEGTRIYAINGDLVKVIVIPRKLCHGRFFKRTQTVIVSPSK
jgi:hypothetical protein